MEFDERKYLINACVNELAFQFEIKKQPFDYGDLLLQFCFMDPEDLATIAAVCGVTYKSKKENNDE